VTHPPQHAPAAPAAPAKKKRRILPILIPIVTFVIGIIIGSAASGSGNTTPSSQPAAPANTTQPAAQPAAQAPAQPAPAPAPAGPKTSFGDGTYQVGTDVAAGSYKSTGPRSGGIGMCYWARLKDDSGQNIIANDSSQGPTRFTAKAGEYVQVTGCDFTKA
jgi:hypothetical protein